MRIGIKPGQIGLSAPELPEYWQAAEAAGFESVWTFDHLTGSTVCPEAVTLLAAMAVTTQRVRIGCLVLANATRRVETLAAQLATVDALSGGRLEVGLGISSAFARLDYDALGLPYPRWTERVASYRDTVDRIQRLTGPDSPIAARPVQAPVPLILGGTSLEVRTLARQRGLAWNYSGGSDGSAERFRRLAEGQPDPQAQVVFSHTADLAADIDRYAAAGATRLVVVLTPPVSLDDVERVARIAGLG